MGNRSMGKGLESGARKGRECVFWSSAWWERSLHETESRRRCATRASGHGYK